MRVTTSARRSCESAVRRRCRTGVGDHRHRGRRRHRREPARLVADRIGLHAAEPDRDHGAEALVVTDPDADVDAGGGHPLHHHRRGVVAEVLAHRGDRPFHVGRVGEVERHAGLGGAAHPRRCRAFTATGKPTSDAIAATSAGVPPVTDAGRRHRDAVAGEQLADGLRRALRARAAAIASGDERVGAGDVDVVGRLLGVDVVGALGAPPVRVRGDPAEHGRRLLGERERRHRRAGQQRAVARPEHDRDDGFGGARARGVDLRARLADRVDQRWRVDHEHGVDRPGRAAPPAPRRGSRRRCCANPSRRGGSTGSSPTASSVARASTPGLGELVTTATRRPLDHRLRGEHPRGVEHRGHGRHLDHAGVAVHRLVAGADQRRAGADRDDRPRPRDPAGDAGELARVAERLGVDRDHLRRLVVLPELQQVVARHVGLVAERHEPRDRQLELCGEPEQGDAERARLHRDRDVARGERHVGERRLQRDVGATAMRCPSSRGR